MLLFVNINELNINKLSLVINQIWKPTNHTNYYHTRCKTPKDLEILITTNKSFYDNKDNCLPQWS